MKILIANLGSTSFKYRLFDMDDSNAAQLASGGYERVTDYTSCIEAMLETLVGEGHLQSGEEIDAVGFKTVLGKDLSGCVTADARVLEALEGFKEVAPAHNPAYAAGIRCFAEKLPLVPRVALFETAFYQWMTPAAYNYAIPQAWRDLGIRRYGFHGASHKFVAERSAEMLGNEGVADRVRQLYVDGPGQYEGAPLRVLSCHLGGSSSVTGIQNGVAIGASMGFSPQGGLPQNNRVGDLDSMAIPYVCKMLGISVEEAERQLNKESGLLGLSGVSNDARDICEAIEAGNENAQLAIDVLIDSIRHWAGSFFFKMGGAEAIVFTAGIGENDADLRASVCAGLEDLGVRIDPVANAAAIRGAEGIISSPDSKIKVLVIPANEELVIAREVFRKVKAS
ncbi:acetate/propionate family kinase [Coraliomargarita sp. SDUM461004]|uniref:Acetate kinase n=1 Tax=Thalassobacterium sedimentorum TaxID=3041258 RepID=A0ABU1AIG1_9BACT|nr:acetate/propionate family kinase [Coraliomargarita sp. SDUM461004]MDQ8194563.1 acetate/propionate family kinase [Coraliomargarita sp. SDUM461004]